MSSFTITKKPTKRDYVVELAKLYNIKINSKSAIELMVQTLSKALGDETQMKRVVQATIKGDSCYENASITFDDWDKFKIAIVRIRVGLIYKEDLTELQEIKNNKREQKKTLVNLIEEFEIAKNKLKLAKHLFEEEE
tara:strand:+ start:53 stop:463 length:411 start_codon:yes stop_codon:yes gene_type:complete